MRGLMASYLFLSIRTTTVLIYSVQLSTGGIMQMMYFFQGQLPIGILCQVDSKILFVVETNITS